MKREGNPASCSFVVLAASVISPSLVAPQKRMVNKSFPCKLISSQKGILEEAVRERAPEVGTGHDNHGRSQGMELIEGLFDAFKAADILAK